MTDREVESSIEVRGTAAQAFRALVDPEELRAWLLDDAESEQQPGGRFRWVWSSRLDDVSEGTYVEYDPPGRLVTESADDDAPGPVVSAYTFEDLGGGRTRVRVVNSGFGSGADWDAALERWRQGAVLFLQALRRRLEEGMDRRQRPRLGVSFGPAENGRQIDAVIPGTGAAAAGLRPGDVVEVFDGEPMTDYDAITVALSQRKAGQTVELGLRRGSSVVTAGVELVSPTAT